MEPRKVLRVAVIHAGRITTERLIHPDETVTIGTSPDNLLRVPDNPVTGERMVLFEPDEGGARLHFTRSFGARSKLASDGRTTELAALKPSPEGLPLDPSHRGKLELGSVLVLFQFVAPPPMLAPEAVAPLDFRPRLLDTDPELLGSLGSWSALALLLSVWVWSAPAPESFDVVGFQERLAHIQPAIVVPPAELEPIAVEEVEVAAAPVEEVAATEPRTDPSPGSEPESEPAAPSKSQQELKQELIRNSKMLAALIGQTGESERAIERAWDGEGVADLDQALAEHRGGITADPVDWDQRPGGLEHGEAASIGDLAHHGGTGEVDGIGGGPVVRVALEQPGGTVAEELVDRTRLKWFVNKHLGEVRYCYEQALKTDADLAGRIELGWTLEAGTAYDLVVLGDSSGHPNLASCVQERVGSWSFPAELEGDVTWPFVFRSK